MKVILLEKIGKLGNLGDQVDVKAGYGRNFLIPHHKAVPATKDSVVEFEKRRAELEKQAQDKRSAADSTAEKLADLSVTITAKAGDEGKLYGSVGTRDIAEAITEAGIKVTKSQVRLPEGPLRLVGEYSIELGLHTDVVTEVQIAVVPE